MLIRSLRCDVVLPNFAGRNSPRHALSRIRISSRILCKAYSSKIPDIPPAPKGSQTYPSGLAVPQWKTEQWLADFLPKWKFLKTFIDYEPKFREPMRCVYKDGVMTRSSVSRGIWVGYATAVFITGMLVTNSKDSATICLESPLHCIGFILVSISFSAYIGIASRTFVDAIYMRDIPNYVKSSAVFRPGKPPTPVYVLTTLHPWTGRKVIVEFNLNDVDAHDDDIEYPNWPFWKRWLYSYGLKKTVPNVYIRDRGFRLENYYFIDGDFQDAIIKLQNHKYRKIKKRLLKPEE